MFFLRARQTFEDATVHIWGKKYVFVEDNKHLKINKCVCREKQTFEDGPSEEVRRSHRPLFAHHLGYYTIYRASAGLLTEASTRFEGSTKFLTMYS